MIVLVCGSRDWSNYDTIKNKIISLLPISKIIHGDCRGADRLADTAAKELGIEVKSFPANWSLHGKSAGPKRNQQMIDEGKPDLILAFHQNIESSKGTKDMVKRAKISGIKIEVIVQ